jgi:hypothetical protein
MRSVLELLTLSEPVSDMGIIQISILLSSRKLIFEHSMTTGSGGYLPTLHLKTPVSLIVRRGRN